MQPGEREAYRLHAKLPAFCRRIDEARQIIAAHPDHAVSVSWGKDSVVLLHLATTIRPDIAAINVRYPNPNERFADMDRVRDLVLSRPEMAGVRYLEVECPGEWEMYERVGYGFADPVTAPEREAVRWWRTELDKATAHGREKLKATGTLMGLRGDESYGRKKNISARGLSYTKRSGVSVALPIGRWSGRDVWSWVVSNDLPWLRIYDTSSVGRERARSGFVFATSGTTAIQSLGIWGDWRRTYPAEFMAWMDRFPGLWS